MDTKSEKNVITFDGDGVFTLGAVMFDLVSGGDVVVSPPRLTWDSVLGSVNITCGDVAVPSAVDQRVNLLCGRPYYYPKPAGLNALCADSQTGTNAGCYTNLVC